MNDLYERLITWYISRHIKQEGKGMGKSFLTSKTLWVNTIAFAAFIIQGYTGFVIDPALQAIALTGVNTILRLVTKSPVNFK